MTEFIVGTRYIKKQRETQKTSTTKDPFAKQLTGINLDKGQVRDSLFIAAETTVLCTAIIISSQSAEHIMGLSLGKAAMESWHSVGMAAWAGIIRGIDILAKPTVGTSQLEKFLNC